MTLNFRLESWSFLNGVLFGYMEQCIAHRTHYYFSNQLPKERLSQYLTHIYWSKLSHTSFIEYIKVHTSRPIAEPINSKGFKGFPQTCFHGTYFKCYIRIQIEHASKN